MEHALIKEASELFVGLDDNNVPFSKVQNYTPVASKLFGLSEEDSDRLGLKVPEQLESVLGRQSDNRYQCTVTAKDGRLVQKDVFFKFCPLTDPIEYLAANVEAPALPEYGCNAEDTSNSPNNAAYVDCLFTKLSTLLGDKYNFPNAVVCYGSIAGIKKSYVCNVEDEIDYLMGNAAFTEGKGSRYEDINSALEEYVGEHSASNRGAISISDDCAPVEIDELGDQFDEVCTLAPTIDSDQDDSDISSRESASGTDEDGSVESSDDDDPFQESKLNIGIKDFPVVGVAMESLEHTLDALLIRSRHPMGEGELSAALLQVIMALIAHQKAYDLTHNDLHSSNIMYSKTGNSHIVYKIGGEYYRVPTFGKIWKIIDFGRAIYKINSAQFCSSSFMEGGDAWSQYNFGPCLSPDKELVEPNSSFDLCRLGISLVDLVDWRDMSETEIGRTIEDWCHDDNGKNIMYKKNGDERYPDFKLYKMIARKVHGHSPTSQLARPVFNRFKVGHKKAKKAARESHIVDMDAISPQFDTPSPR